MKASHLINVFVSLPLSLSMSLFSVFFVRRGEREGYVVAAFKDVYILYRIDVSSWYQLYVASEGQFMKHE
jgi:protein-S-isoprenylcysteine O-methyltransferase Ste14